MHFWILRNEGMIRAPGRMRWELFIFSERIIFLGFPLHIFGRLGRRLESENAKVGRGLLSASLFLATVHLPRTDVAPHASVERLIL